MADKLKLYPSSASRWITCPGSVKLEPKFPDPETTKYAKQGTAAHALAERCLNEGVNADTYLGEEFEGVAMKQEDCDAVQIYLEYVWGQYEEPCEFKVETRTTMPWIHSDLRGNIDAYIYKPKKKELVVIDYKHGQGIPVEPEWSPQGMIYALGTIHHIWEEFTKAQMEIRNVLEICDKIKIVIVQPRFYNEEDHIKEWEVSTRDLLWWGLHILKPATVEASQEDADFKAGPHCRFCSAKIGCQTFAAHLNSVAKTDIKDMQRSLPAPDSLDPASIGKVLESADLFKAWIDEVRQFAKSLLEMGNSVPGFKLVTGKSNRKWLDPEGVAQELLTVLSPEQVYDNKLRTVAQIEKVTQEDTRSRRYRFGTPL